MDLLVTEHQSWKRWIILFGLFLTAYLDIGTMKSFGVFLDSMTEDLHTSLALVGVAIGISHAISQFFALVNVPLLRHFTPGRLIAVGGVVGAVGYGLNYFAKSGVDFLLIMLLPGFGYGIVIVPGSTCVLDFFPQHFEIATTVVKLGSGVGMMTLPLLTERLVEAYTWRGAVLILGALNLHNCVTGYLMTTTTTERRRRQNLSSSSKTQAFKESEETAALRHGPDSSGMRVVPEGNDQGSDGADKPTSHCLSAGRVVKSVLLDTFDLKLLYDYPRLNTIILTFFTFAASFCGWIIFLIPNAQAKGIETGRAVLLATVGGAANILGRLIIGILAARLAPKPQVPYCIISLISAVAFFCNFFVRDSSILCCFAAMNGFAIGGKVVSGYLLCKDTIPDERFTAGIAFLSMIYGIGEVIWSLVIGLLYDATKSFNIMFCLLGAANVLESCFIISPIIYDGVIAITRRVGAAQNSNAESDH